MSQQETDQLTYWHRDGFYRNDDRSTKMCRGNNKEGRAPDCYPFRAPTPKGGWKNERRGWLRFIDLIIPRRFA